MATAAIVERTACNFILGGTTQDIDFVFDGFSRSEPLLIRNSD